MAAVEVDEVELLRLRKQDQTVQHIWGNPKARRKIQEAVKEADPNMRIPELEIEEAAKAPVMALEKTVKELQEQIAADKADREKNDKLNALNYSVETGFGKLRKAGWTDDGLVEVKKLMEERGIIDPEIAAAYYEKQHPPQVPATPSGVGAWNFGEVADDTDAYSKALMASKNAAENDSLVMREAGKALQEIRGASRR